MSVSVTWRVHSPGRFGGRRGCGDAPSCNLDRECRVRTYACLETVHRFLHCVDSRRAGAVVQQILLLAQNVAESFDGVTLVKVSDSVSVLSLDVADSAVAVRSQVGVETYKRSRTTVFVVDADPHAQMLVMFGGDQLDILGESRLDFFVSVRIV